MFNLRKLIMAGCLVAVMSVIKPITVQAIDPDVALNPDVLLLAQVMVHEAQGEGEEGMLAVGSVVMNRVNSELFPDTISEVVYQKKQFSGSRKIAKITPTEEEIALAEQVLQEGTVEEDVLYFRNAFVCGASKEADWGEHEYKFSIGNHSFYTQ